VENESQKAYIRKKGTLLGEIDKISSPVLVYQNAKDAWKRGGERLLSKYQHYRKELEGGGKGRTEMTQNGNSRKDANTGLL